MIKVLKIAIAVLAIVGPAAVSEAATDRYDRRVTLVNNSRQTIVEFRASNVGTDAWEEDILGDSVVRPGRSVRINLNDGTGYCRFDFKTRTEDGGTIIRRGVNVCEVSTYTIR